MTALLAIGGEGPGPSILADRTASFDIICAADSGLDLLRGWGLAPRLIVGDMDSVSTPDLEKLYPEAEILRYPRAKDYSDTELAIRLLCERGYTDICLAGGGGGRIDHLIALLAMFEHRGRRPREWYTRDAAVFLIEEGRGHRVFRCREGDTVSVFPLSSGASGMKSEGLRWALDGLVWKAGDYGLSNETTGSSFSVEAGKGDILVVIFYRRENRPL